MFAMYIKSSTYISRCCFCAFTKLPADIPITITGSIIQIPIESTCIRTIIPFTA